MSSDTPSIPRALKPCATCGTLVPGGSRHCPACATKHHQAHNAPRRSRYHTPHWRQQRARVIQRDRDQCVVCGSTTRLHVHHVQWNADQPIVPDDQLVTLCQYHHGQLEMNHRLGKACPVQARLDQHLADSPHHGDNAGEWNPFG